MANGDEGQGDYLVEAKQKSKNLVIWNDIYINYLETLCIRFSIFPSLIFYFSKHDDTFLFELE